MLTATLWAEFIFNLLCRVRWYRAAATWAHCTGLVWMYCQRAKASAGQ